MTEENEAFNDDILSAALSEAGLEEFFEPPSAAASTNSSNFLDDGDDAPTEVLCEEIVRTGFPPPPPPPPPSLSGLNRSNQSTELASPATASTGTSPDLPVETISRPSTSSTMDSVQKSPVVTSTPPSPNTSASSMHNYYSTTRPPTKTSNNNIIIKHPANQLNTPSSIATGSTSSSAAATSGTRYIKYVTPEGKMLLLPMSSIQQHGLQSPIVRLVYASKTAPTSTTPSASAAPRHLNPVIINNAPRVTNNMVMPPPVLEPILPVFRRVAPHYNKNLRIVPPPPSAASRFGLPAPRHAPHPNPPFSSSFASRRLGRGGSSTTGGATVGGGSKRNVTFSQMVVDVEEEFNRRYSSLSSTSRLPTVSHVTLPSMSTSSMSMPTSFGVDNEVTVASAAPPGGKNGGGSQQQANAFADQQFFEPAGVYADPTRFANKFHQMDKDKENPMIRLIPLDLRPKSSMTSSTPTSLASSTTDVKKVEPASMSSVALEDPDEEEDLGHAETYSEYTPAKLRSGLNHPDPVVETSSLSSVTPPDIFYHFTIPEYLVDTGKLSALQLEAIIYACQQHENFNPNRERVGYLVGDGAGVGKGRTIAGLIYENYLLGRKRALWFSVSSDLKYDAERDLADIGAEKIKVHALNKFKYMRISGKENGGVKKGVIFATYSSLIGESNNAKSKYRSRLKQLIHWCGGKDFEGLIVFDECHRAKNLVPTGTTKPTKTGQIVLEIQKELPKARVVYASATGATETRNMAYMTRLGLWGPGKPFKDFTDFITAVEKRGVGAMEIVAMDMKQRGLYLARQLSFAGTSFRIEEVPLSLEFIHMYDESVKLWLEARKQFQRASELVGAERGDRKSMWGQFWASHQRFFKYLCIAAKVGACVRMAREAVKNGKCVVIGLQSTGEARTLEQLEECGGELNEFVSTAKGVFMSLIEKHFPMSDNSNEINLKNLTTKEARHSLFGDMGDLFGDDKKRSYKRRASERFNNAAKRSKRDALTKRLSSSDNTDDDDSDKESSSRDKNKSDKDESTSTSNDEDSDKDSDKQSQSSSGSESDSSSIVSNERESDDEENERFNPFADEEEEQDPWEFKIRKSQKKKSKKRKKPTKKDLEEVDELGKQLEEAMEERIVEKHSQVKEVAIDVDDFLHTTSTFLDPYKFTSSSNRFDASLGLSEVNVKKAELLSAVERLGDLLPANTLDQLIDDLGGPEYVAEMTGRKGRVVTRDDGEIQYELRNEVDVPLELLNLAEKERFMKGEKHIAIISEAASSGISLQSDRRAKNQRRRVHITLELPWSADKAIQQFGRTHRSNQVNAPEYVFLISELAGEQRFASVVAKRLESLGALTHGDRRATESRDLSQFNLDTKYGRVALDVTLKSILGHSTPVVKPPADYKGNFFIDMRQYMEGVGIAGRSLEDNSIWMVEKDMNMAKFLNRILGLPVYAQNALFQYFSDTLKAVVEEAKKDGRYDMGIMDLGSGREKVKKVETRVFIGKFDAGGYKTELHLVAVERGTSWDEAMDLYTEHTGSDDGFYVSSNSSVKPTAVFICAIARRRLESNERLFNVYRPNTGLNITMETLPELRHRYKKILPDAAERIWKEQYDISESRCQHVFWFGKCRNELAGLTCEVGKRKRSYYILSGSVLSVWNSVEHILTSGSSIGKRLGKMQVVRVRTDQDQKIVGILVPNTFVRAVVDRLSEESSRTYVETFR